MKRRVLTGITTLFLFLSTLMAQEVAPGVMTAFKKGNSKELNKHMGDTVNLVLDGRAVNFNKQKATIKMQDFFAENKVTSLIINHQSKRDESGFVVFTLTTSTGKHRVNCFLKKVKEQYLIHQIRIEKVNE